MTMLIRLAAAAILMTAQLAWSASAVRELATVTGTNVGFVSSQIAQYQKGVNEIAARRIELIASLERLAAEGRMEAEREVAVLKATGGGEIVKIFEAVREQADKAAAAPALLDAVQAQAKKDAASVYTPLAYSTAKLDESAKSLATLGRSRSLRDQLKFTAGYLKDARDEVEKLKEDAESKKKSADSQMESKAANVEAPKKPNAATGSKLKPNS